MDSGRFLFDPSPVHGHGNMLFLGNTDHVFRGARSMLCIDETAKRARPFFSSADELYNDEYYDEQLPEKKRRLSAEQVHMLEKSFETDNKLEPERKTQLAKKLGLQQRQVAVWFQNRRARWKNKQLEKDYHLLRSSYDSLLSDFDSIAKEHEKLKSEVQYLSEKLQAKEVVTGEPISNPKSETTVTETDEDGPQVVDSGNSYFPNTNYTAPVDGGVLSEEDDGSDDGQNYFSDVFEQIQDEGEHLGWWVWS